MVKKVIRLSESDIHQIIKESINQILNEVGDTEDGQKKLGALARRKMDDGSLYKFKAEEYTEYTITNEYIVVKRNECWIGVFDKKHFVSLILENK